MEIPKITNDGFYILLFLCPGYLAFRVYFIDKQWNSLAPIHVFYGSLVFSIFTYIAFGLSIEVLSIAVPVEKFGGYFVFALMTTPFALLIGALWRRFGHNLFHATLIKMRITNEDNNATPWMQLFNNPKIRLSQITVHLKDGSSYFCDETGFFDTKELRKVGIFSHYTCVEGDIYFVANKYRGKDAVEWEDIPDVHIVPPWGIKIQWIPAREIARVEARAIEVT